MKRVFTLLLALSMLFATCTSLSACDDDDSAASLGESADSELSDNASSDVVDSADSSVGVAGAETSEDKAQSELVTLYLLSNYTIQSLGGDSCVFYFTYDEQFKTFSCSENAIDGGEKFIEGVFALTCEERGNITEEVYYKDGEICGLTHNGEEYQRYTHAYDESGNITEEIWYMDGEEGWRCTYAYDESGNVTEKVDYDNGEERYRYTYAYDENENMTEKVHYYNGEIGSLTYNGEVDRITYAYDENGNAIEEIYSCQFSGGERTTYTYDENGNLTEKVWENAGWKIRRTYAYDENGNVRNATEETYECDYRDGEDCYTYAYDESYTYTYDENGNVTKELYYVNGEQRGSYTCAYIAVQVSAERAKAIEKRYQDFLSFIDLTQMQQTASR